MKKMAVLILMVVIISGCNNQKNDSIIERKSELITESSSKELIKFSTTDWVLGSWQAFNFKYPSEFKLTDGKFDETYFYLDYNGNPEQMIRIYGISERWNKPLHEVIEIRKNNDKQGFPDYSFLDLQQISNNTFVYCYTWEIDDTYKTCQSIKEYNEVVRFLTVSAPINVWNENNEVFDKILSSVN